MSTDIALRLAYGANILILAPVVLWLVRAEGTAIIFGPAMAESQGLRLLVVALWSAILLCSAVGLLAPRLFVGILVLQIIYKSIWLICYVAPVWREQGAAAVPWGPAVCFAAIIAIWPFIVVQALHG